MMLLGIRVDEIDRNEARKKVFNFLFESGQKKIFTPNPEMIVDVQENKVFRDILNSGDLNICDGRGVELVSNGRLERIPGIDFIYDICHICQKYNKKIYIIGSGSDEIIQKAKKNINKIFPELVICGSHKGPKLSIQNNKLFIYDNEENQIILDEICTLLPDVLFVGFGHNKQEQWINNYLNKLPSVKIAMGIGGSFDIISGRIKRAPRFMRKAGLEWFWRLINEPWRANRMWKATIYFLYLNMMKKHKYAKDTN